MRYEQNLQVKLRERYRRLFKTSHDGYATECRYLRDFILRVPTLKAIVESLQEFDRSLDAHQWIADKFDFRGYEWPDSEEGRAKVVWQFLNELAAGDHEPFQVARVFATSSDANIPASLRDMSELAFEPFIEYLEERIGTASQVLYLLERLKQRVETFDAGELFVKYTGDTAHGEAIYDHYIRKFLFDQGVDYIISQPRSASGEADIVAQLNSEDALVEESKLYNGKNYGIPYVRKGFNQAVQYAHDYNKTTAHLIVINLSSDNLQLPSDEDTTIWPPRLQSSGVTVYIVVIRAADLESASSRGSQRTIKVERDDLIPRN